jgi:hypothetical protein
MKKCRIICEDSSLEPKDAAGLHVFNEYRSITCSKHVNIINGYLDDRIRRSWLILQLDRRLSAPTGRGPSHNQNSLYLLKSLSFFNIILMPTMYLIGVEGGKGGGDQTGYLHSSGGCR